MPTNQVLAGGVAGAVVTIAVYAFKQSQPALVIPPELVAAATTIVSFVSAWFVRNRATDPVAAAPLAQPAE